MRCCAGWMDFWNEVSRRLKTEMPLNTIEFSARDLAFERFEPCAKQPEITLHTSPQFLNRAQQ